LKKNSLLDYKNRKLSTLSGGELQRVMISRCFAQQPEVISFIDRFREAYSMEPTLDQFAFQGYDITYFFVKALVTFGNGFGEEVNQMEAPLLSTRFKFHKNNRLTYENGFVHLYRISDDFHYVNAWQAAEATEENLSAGKDAKNKRKK
ncbi:MAG: hypothetical protein J5792_07740, partial [Bacteroidales bacterium]|nr:hypothetical protein [Bacteroidales bacterium]